MCTFRSIEIPKQIPKFAIPDYFWNVRDVTMSLPTPFQGICRKQMDKGLRCRSEDKQLKWLTINGTHVFTPL